MTDATNAYKQPSDSDKTQEEIQRELENDARVATYLNDTYEETKESLKIQYYNAAQARIDYEEKVKKLTAEGKLPAGYVPVSLPYVDGHANP